MASVIQNWSEIIRTQTLSDEREMDLVSRWLLIVRASVFPMTLTSGIVGGLLALADPRVATFNSFHFFLALLGLIVAHAANNMINDYFDLEGGVDTEGYVRTAYAPHPILNGLISKTGLGVAILLANLVDLAILIYFVAEVGWLVLAFALIGLFISVFYVAPPLKLKHHGLGEPGVFLVWGPLMVGGTYLVCTGEIHAGVFAASIPYALLVMAVLMGKHMDKLEADSARGIRTLPVLLGVDRARQVTQALVVGFFPAVILLVLSGDLPVWTLLSLLAIPRVLQTLKTFDEPKPTEPPENFPIWPLWYVAWAFVTARFCGGLLIAGLILAALFPIYL